MIDRSCARSRVSLPALEATQRKLGALREMDSLSRGFSLLGDATRLKILLSLANAGELCVYDLADILEMETSAISHQLRKLRDGNLVANEREGPTIYYRLAADALRDLLVTGRALLSVGAPAAV